MRKLTLLLCCWLLLQLLCSCSGKKEEFKEPVNFYYCSKEVSYNSPTGVIQPETREGSGFHDNLTAYLNAYLRGPASEELESTIPTDVYLVSCEVNGSTITIVLSAQFAKLSGIDLSTACSALLLSAHEFTGADTLKLIAKGNQLDGKDEILLNLADIVLIDAVD